ncbi:hypothetical protein [Kitasatospora sp. NPDC097643]|uniref:hypothetical protein n=1 Tax=Kitasatospora sp. NPDC097643 TaxID=3157230 RepID=UPI00331A9A82
MPEVLAVFAVRHRGPRAARRVAGLRAGHPETPPGELVDQSVKRAKRVSVSEGSFVGGPFTWLVPFAFCTALLEQGQMMLELAALAGKDPTAPARTAELLVLQGVHPDVAAAEKALARGPGAEPSAGRARGFWQVIWRMARLLGITGEDAVPPPSRLRVTMGWIGLGLTILVGMVIPLVWLPFMAISYGHATDRIADRAVAFHFEGPRPARPARRGLDPGVLGASVRAGVSLLLTVGAVVTVLVADLRLGDSLWPVLVLVLVGLSTAVGAIWYRRRRGHRAAGARHNRGSGAAG